MGRKKKIITPPWAYEDNERSRYGSIYIDLLKSTKWQSLSNPAKIVYFIMCAHSHDEMANKCLYQTIKELDAALGLNTPEQDIQRVVHESNYEYFVFPLKQYQAYGLDKGTVWKAKTELIQTGFIEEPVRQQKRMRVNIYRFSTNWKKKGWICPKHKGDRCITFWHG